MIVLFFGFIIIMFLAMTVAIIYVNLMKNQNIEEYKSVEELKRRIDELDDDNVKTDNGTKTAKIIVPDIVNPDESTRTSTQKEECKEYEVGPKQKIEKTVIGTDKKDEIFVNTEIERVEDEEDSPIKEKESLLSKIIKNKKTE